MSKLTYTLDINATSVNKVTTEIGKLKAELASLSPRVNSLKKDLATLTTGARGRGTAASELRKQIVGAGSYEKAIRKVRSELAKLEKAQTEVNSKLRVNTQGLKESEKAAVKLNFVNEKYENTVTKLKRELAELNKELRELGAANTTASRNIEQLERRLSSVQAKANAAAAALGRVNSGGTGTSGDTGGTSGGGIKIGRLLGSLAIVQTAVLIERAVTEALQSASEAIIEFEAELANLGAILNEDIGSKNFNIVAQQARELGATTAFTAVEVAQLQTELAKLGFNVPEIEASTKAIIDFSIATRTTADRAAKLGASTLKAFNLEASEMERVLGGLARATTLTALDFSKLETQLPIVGAAANAYNISIEKTTAILGVLADRGVDASTAATAFRNILLRSAKAGLTYQEALQQVAQSSDQALKAFELFGVRGAVQAVILANNLDEVVEKTAAITDQGDFLEEFANKQLNTVTGAVKLLTSAWEGFSISIDDSNGIITKFFRSGVEGATSLLNILTRINEGDTIAQARTDNTINNLENSVKRLSAATKGSVEYAKALRELTLEYPEYLALLQKEGIALGDLEGMLEIVNKLRIGSDITRANTNISNLESEIALGEKKVENIQTQIDVLKQSGKSTEDLTNILAIQEAEINANTKALQAYRTELARLEETSPTELPAIRGVGNFEGLTEKGAIEGLTDAIERYNKKLKETNLTEAESNQIQQDKLEAETKLSQLLRDRADRETFQEFDTLVGEGSPARLVAAANNIQTLNELQEIFSATREAATIGSERYKLAEEGIIAVKERLSSLSLEETKDKKEDLDATQKLIKSIADLQAAYDNLSGGSAAGSIAELEAQLSLLQAQFKSATTDVGRSELELQIFGVETAIDRLLASGKIEEYKRGIAQLTQDITTVQEGNGATLSVERFESASQAITDQAKRSAEAIKEASGAYTEYNEAVQETANLQAELAQLQRQQDFLIKIGVSTDSEEYTKVADSIAKLTSEIETSEDATVDIVLRVNREESSLEDSTRALQAQLDREQELIEKYQIQRDLIEDPTKRRELYQQFLSDRAALDEEYRILELQRAAAAAEIAYNEAISNDALTYAEKLKLEQEYLQASRAFKSAEIEEEARRNETELKNEETLLKAKLRAQQQYLRTVNQTATQIGTALGDVLTDSTKSVEDVQKEILKAVVKGVVGIIRANIIAAQSSALVGAGTLNFAQVAASAAALAGLAGLEAAANNIIENAFEYGGVIGGVTNKGGKVQGPSHSKGGVKFIHKGRLNEYEGGEVVINKKSSAKFAPLLSEINSYKGWGKKFNEGGVIGSNIPQLLNPNNTTTISEDSIERLGSRLRDETVAILTEQNSQLVSQLQAALIQVSRYNSLRAEAQQNSLI